MAVAVVHSRALSGVDAPRVTVEVHLAGGLPAVQHVGTQAPYTTGSAIAQWADPPAIRPPPWGNFAVGRCPIPPRIFVT